MKPFSLILLAALSSVSATAAWGSAVLPAAVGSAACMSDNPVTTVEDSSACELGRGLATVSVATDPFVDVVSHVGSAAGVASFDAIGALTYSFEVVGGRQGDHVPLLVATALETTVSDPRHNFGGAGIVVTSPSTVAQVRVCAGDDCDLDSSFSGALHVETVSGHVGTVQLITQAENTFLFGGTADASIDPLIFIDPSFSAASTYAVLVSDGVGNGLAPAPIPTVPEPTSFVLLGVGLVTLVCVCGLWPTSRKPSPKPQSHDRLPQPQSRGRE